MAWNAAIRGSVLAEPWSAHSGFASTVDALT
jgi:hypothetical protein